MICLKFKKRSKSTEATNAALDAIVVTVGRRVIAGVLICNGWNIIIVCVIEVVGRVQSTDDNGPMASLADATVDVAVVAFVAVVAVVAVLRRLRDVISGVECGNRCQLTGRPWQVSFDRVVSLLTATVQKRWNRSPERETRGWGSFSSWFT